MLRFLSAVLITLLVLALLGVSALALLGVDVWACRRPGAFLPTAVTLTVVRGPVADPPQLTFDGETYLCSTPLGTPPGPAPIPPRAPDEPGPRSPAPRPSEPRPSEPHSRPKPPPENGELFSDGFESGDARAWNSETGQSTYPGEGCHSGARCGAKTLTGGRDQVNTHWTKALNYVGEVFRSSVWFRFPRGYSWLGAGPGDEHKLLIIDTADNIGRVLVNLRDNTDPILSIYVESLEHFGGYGPGRGISQRSGVHWPQDGAWHQLEVELTRRPGNDARAVVRLDGRVAIDRAGRLCGSSCSPIVRERVGAYVNQGSRVTETFYVDDVMIRSDAGPERSAADEAPDTDALPAPVRAERWSRRVAQSCVFSPLAAHCGLESRRMEKRVRAGVLRGAGLPGGLGLAVLLGAALWTLASVGAQEQVKPKPRARELGVPFEGTPGPLDAITDVAGVEVGMTTLVSGDGPLKVGVGPVRTGVTAILPRGKAAKDAVFAGWFSLNGNGEMTGTAWIEEAGFLEGPVFITNTHSVGTVRDAAIQWGVERGRLFQPWALPVVAETYDGFLNDINGFHVKPEHVKAALDGARGGAVAEGNVGGGTAMSCYGFKCGTGTASRKVAAERGGYTVGVLVQANHGGRRELRIAGVPVGQEIPQAVAGGDVDPARAADAIGDLGSIIIVVATDAPLAPHQLKRVARRAALGLARTGSISGNGSGDLFLAFSTANPGVASAPEVAQIAMLSNARISAIFEATVQATEEAIVNALVAAETMTGIDGHRVEALPHEALRQALQKYNRLALP